MGFLPQTTIRTLRIQHKHCIYRIRIILIIMPGITAANHLAINIFTIKINLTNITPILVARCYLYQYIFINNKMLEINFRLYTVCLLLFRSIYAGKTILYICQSLRSFTVSPSKTSITCPCKTFSAESDKNGEDLQETSNKVTRSKAKNFINLDMLQTFVKTGFLHQKVH